MHKVHLSPYPSGFPIQELNDHLKALYALLGAGKEDVFHFTSGKGATLQQIFFSHYFDFIRQTGRNHILTHPILDAQTKSILKQCEVLGCISKPLPLNAQGQIAKQALIERIRPRSSLLSLSWVDPLTGVIQPLHDIIDVCKKNEIRIHVDATHALGKLFFRFKDLEIDFLSIEGFALKASCKSSGFLARSSVLLERSGEDLGEEVAVFVQSVDSALQAFDHFSTETARLRDKFEKKIQEKCPEARLLFQETERLSTCSVIAFPGMGADTLMHLLQKKGIYPCLGGGKLPLLSSLLMSYGMDPLLAHSALSFTLSEKTTEEEVDLAVEQIIATVEKMRPWSRGLNFL